MFIKSFISTSHRFFFIKVLVRINVLYDERLLEDLPTLYLAQCINFKSYQILILLKSSNFDALSSSQSQVYSLPLSLSHTLVFKLLCRLEFTTLFLNFINIHLMAFIKCTPEQVFIYESYTQIKGYQCQIFPRKYTGFLCLA